MDETTLQPRNIRNVLGDASRAYGEMFFSVAPLSFVIALLLNLLTYVFQTMVETLDHASLFFVLAVLLGIFQMTLITLGFGLLLLHAYAFMTKATETLSARIKQVTKRFFTLLMITIITTTLTLLGGFLFLFPGIFLAILLMFALPTAVLEKKGMMASIRKSLALVWGNWWRTFMTFLMPALLIIFLVSTIDLFWLHTQQHHLMHFLFQVITTTITFPFFTTLVIMQLSDLQVRKAIKDAEELENTSTNTD